MRMGIPRLLKSDNGKELKNELDAELIKLLGMRRIFTTPYHPQAGTGRCMQNNFFLFFLHCRQMDLMRDLIRHSRQCLLNFHKRTKLIGTHFWTRVYVFIQHSSPRINSI